jgi:hypothetical protein
MLLVQTLSQSCPLCVIARSLSSCFITGVWHGQISWTCVRMSHFWEYCTEYFLFVCLFVIYVVIPSVAQIIVFNVVTISEEWFRKDIKGAALPALKHYPFMMIVREGTKNFRIASVLVSIWTRTSWTVVIGVYTIMYMHYMSIFFFQFTYFS